ncbi:sn-glycerol-3-phosphate ABC transporter ATP-binding protein UgpC [Agrobacterium genomosp. 3 str. CIP 111-78]|jgi:multiple sugar transport system ATP-binding protein|uniref:Sn-glycerol-3-phosphate ABC transporter ATP-binding protein UgpC n=1 Tax=Agrobacterium tumefaciens TaxID=358 RepID=A0AAE6BSS2_AGRTU|nr:MULTISPECIES: sn-glycerol-3-phosphate ABC transporter ATP-binding protein UgpC [Rhizobium/Agrobacterium group]KNY30863.1 sugar ABC transporter ATP-binding protein [Agrobacterium sp. SUL3]KRA62294.1 sugar ABC transporter ATP-binding protein [Rhizobium sp. Root651]MCA2372662.1 sn-glycerol-3-phosphate ABC transporter ATP-binding protein UgpC [Agrobacterium tomkonis CIP 111-78]MDH1270880.1 sn-glycerol-3-phosphate ABC transporter ATP-binding protein UgpC [Agrobacterium pusense]QCM03638.1 sn-glyc
MARVEIRKLHKHYGDFHALRELTVAMEDGEFVVLVGPSGCGKSTLLRMIAGLEDVSDGEIHIDGRVINNIESKDRDIAMVFQNYALYPHMTVYDNMAFSMKLRRAPTDKIRQEVEAAAAILGLSDHLERYPRQLSGGQRQRVAMGRAIVRKPKVFLFDEPLSNLDAKLRVKMRSEIKSLHRRLGNTMIYVTHDQVEAMTMADRIVVMQGGIIEQVGSPLELYDRPANLFVAGFIGSPAMNFINGRSTDTGFVMHDGTHIALPAPFERPSGEVLLGIRPESLALCAPGDPAAVQTSIVSVEPTGAESHATLILGGEEVTAVFRERLPGTPGAPLSVKLSAAGTHLFDKATGARLSGGEY